jgi:hypothetical protein
MTSTPTEKLRECPFCPDGGEPYVHAIGNDHSRKRGDGAEVGCEKCHFSKRVGVVHYSVEWAVNAAIAAWNTRAMVATPTDASLVRRLEEVREKISMAFKNRIYPIGSLPYSHGERCMREALTALDSIVRQHQSPPDAAEALATGYLALESMLADWIHYVTKVRKMDYAFAPDPGLNPACVKAKAALSSIQNTRDAAGSGADTAASARHSTEGVSCLSSAEYEKTCPSITPDSNEQAGIGDLAIQHGLIDSPTAFAHRERLESALKGISDENKIDAGIGFGGFDFWIKLNGVEYHLHAKPTGVPYE